MEMSPTVPINSAAPYYPPMVEPWQEALWFLLTAIMFLAWWAYFAKRHRVDFSATERLLAAFIATIAQILATTLVTGMLHRIGWWELAVSNFACAGILIAFGSGADSVRLLGGEVETLCTSLWRLLRSSIALRIIFSMAAMIAIWQIYLGQLLPPIGIDSWSYHLVWPALAHQERHLGPYGLQYPWVNAFTMNTEILFLWSIVGSGTDRWADITQSAPAFAAVLASYLLARRVGARKVDAAASGLLVMGVPIVIEEMGKPYVDIAVLAGFLISLVFLARRKLTPASIVVAGTSAGFMIGAKSFAAFSFLVLFGFLIFRVFLLKSGFPARLRKIEIKSSIRLILTYVVCCILFGGYFYIRNMVLTGNPTAIFKVELMGVELFHGERDVAGTMANAQIVGKGIYEALHSGREFPLIMAGLFDPQRYFHTIGGGGALWIVLMIPAILFAVVYAVIRRRWLLVAIVISCIIPMLCFKYDRVMMRYYIQIIGAGTTAFGYLLTLLSRTRYRRLLLSIAVVLMGLMISLTSPPTGWRVKVDDIRLARSAPYMARDRYVYYHSWGDPRFANALKIVVQPGTTLALADELPGYANLAGWNAGYSNRVVWVAWPGSGDEWESNLRKAGAQAIYVSNSNDGLGWAKSHPSSFETVYESSNLGAIFKLVPVDTGQ